MACGFIGARRDVGPFEASVAVEVAAFTEAVAVAFEGVVSRAGVRAGDGVDEFDGVEDDDFSSGSVVIFAGIVAQFDPLVAAFREMEFSE